MIRTLVGCEWVAVVQLSLEGRARIAFESKLRRAFTMGFPTNSAPICHSGKVFGVILELVNFGPPGCIWESFRDVWVSIWTSREAFGSHFGVFGILLRRTGVNSKPQAGHLGVTLGSEIEDISKFGSGVDFRSFFCLPKRSFWGKSTSCKRNVWFGGVAGPGGGSDFAAGRSAGAVNGAPAAGAASVGGYRGGRNRFEFI